MLLIHLSKIATKSDKNLMTVSNLGVCFGPTLLRPEEETVAAIMDIKFANVVVEILIQNWHTLLKTKPDTNPPPKPSHSKSQTVTPVKTSPTVKPPPYVPPPPPGSSVSPPTPSAAPPTLVQTVIFDGPKMQAAVQPGPGPVNNNGGPGYATWERTLRGSTPGSGPGQPPGPGSVSGQPSGSSRGLSSVSSSLSNLSSVSTPTGNVRCLLMSAVHSNMSLSSVQVSRGLDPLRELSSFTTDNSPRHTYVTVTGHSRVTVWGLVTVGCSLVTTPAPRPGAAEALGAAAARLTAWPAGAARRPTPATTPGSAPSVTTRTQCQVGQSG